MANEKRLIDANALKKQFIDYVRTQPHFHYGDWKNMCINGTEIDEVVDNAPTVDAVEVVHGRWDTIWYGTDSRGNVVKCSVCGYRKFDTTDNYCPNCGAKMDGGNEDG